MSKGLEALDKLVNHINLLNHISGVERQEVFEPFVNKNKSIIEQELKRLEELEKAFDALSKENEKVFKELSKEIEKNRVLEILRECNLTIDEFNKQFYFISGKVPKDKVDLLKDVLS